MAQQYDFISSDTHLEVLPERWTGRVPARYRDKMPRTVPHPDGGDAIRIESAPLFQVAYLDLRAGRTSEDWQPFDVRVEETAGVGPAEQRLREQDQDGCAAEVLFPNMQAGPGLWRNIADDAAYLAAIWAYNDWLGEEYCAVNPKRLIGLGGMPMTTTEDSLKELEHCVALELRHHLGVEHIMFATDFPHIECEWPNTKPTLDSLTARLSPEEKYKIVAGNVINYFGLDPDVFNKPE